ncbi:response regulator transcription factor [Microbulbifer sp. SAOS-129_SWC]|uniref:response regulator transcription factor n=1 Tax=Microbulbifer sp. SAOS-129_SWC TaxID=3145235 RepID=UPI0032162A08
MNSEQHTGEKRILLVDDHGLMRAGMRALLDDMPGIRVVSECGNGLEALDIARHELPDIVLLDISLPGLNGLEVARQLRQAYPQIHVLMLSMHEGPEYVARALHSGAAGYLLKDSAFDELATALASVFSGRTYLCSALDPEIIARFADSAQRNESVLEILTPRQRQILQLIAEGHGPREIAAELNVSVKTVEAHRAQLMERLGIHHVPGLVRFAIRVGLISSEL